MDGQDFSISGTLLLLFISLLWLIGSGIDYKFYEPQAADVANDYCEARGFDQHKSFKRIGFFSTEPVAVKCEYAEKYTDLGVRVN